MIKSKSPNYIMTVSQSASLSSAPIWGPMTRFLLLSDSCWFVDAGCLLFCEDGSVVYNCQCSHGDS
jgi:hypothetical protein